MLTRSMRASDFFRGLLFQLSPFGTFRVFVLFQKCNCEYLAALIFASMEILFINIYLSCKWLLRTACYRTKKVKMAKMAAHNEFNPFVRTIVSILMGTTTKKCLKHPNYVTMENKPERNAKDGVIN